MNIELIEPRQVGESPAAQAPQRGELSVVQYMVQSGATVEQVQAAMELQVRADNHKLEMMREKRRMDEEDRKAAAVLAYRRDFAGFRGENIVVPKNKHVNRGKAGSFDQAEYDLVVKMISPGLSKHGFSFRHDQKFGVKEWPTAENPHNRMGWVWVTCYLEHKDGHVETLELEGPEGDQSANTPVQNMQLTASYLKRQSLLAITGTPTGGEDDENKMRRRAKPDADDDGGADDEAESLLDAGRDEALKGMKALTAWWAGLTGKQRTSLSPDFPGMRKAAQAADAAGGAK